MTRPKRIKMTLKKTIRLILAFGLTSVLFTSIQAIPADSDFSFMITQPDGSSLQLHPVGDERNGCYCTSDGYTVIKSSDGWYYYAQLDQNGNLTPTKIKAHSQSARKTTESDFVQTMTPYLKPSATDRLYPDPHYQPELLNSSFSKNADTVENNVLVILIQFYDYVGTYDSSNFDDLMNLPGYDIYGSAHDFYEECSYGQFNLKADVTHWYQAESEYYFYGYHDGNNWVAAAQLVREAVIAASYSVDFSKYDNNNDGEVDGLFIVHAGPGAETGASDFPWSHKWWLTAAGLDPVNVNGVTVDAYTLEPELHYGTEIARIGVFCHEYGHALGLPDLYDTDGSSNGIGSWGVMGGGSWNGGGRSPAHFSGWSKDKLGWTTPINILTDTTDVIIPDASSNPVSYRLWTEGAESGQYFLVEYRGKTNFDSFLPGCGVAIWHVDESMTGNSVDNHRLLDLEEGDNTENNSSGDVWINKTFNGTSIPNSNDYNSNPTEVEVKVNSTFCDNLGMHVDFKIGVPAGCCIGNRGNVNGDKDDQIDISDIVYFVNYSFATPSGPEPPCFEEADVDGSGDLSIADIVYLVTYSFGTPAGPAPLPCQL